MRNHRSTVRNAATVGLFLVLAGCTASGGGCTPIDASPTTTVGESTTTTIEGSTTTTGPDGSTTTTTGPGGSTTTTEPDTSTTTTLPTDPGEAVSVDTLDIADCMTPTSADAFVNQVVVLDCATPHGSEVFAQYELDEDGDVTEFPGGTELTWAAQDRCQDEFEPYVGESYWDSIYDLTTITPSFSTWDAGDRTVTCLIIDPDGNPLTGPARNSGR